MSLSQLNKQEQNWNLRNTLTIFNNVEVKGDLNSTGFIYDGNIPIEVVDDDNVWTGLNTFSNFQPTVLDPVNDDDLANVEYVETAFANLGASFLPLNNIWTGANTMTQLPVITNNATVGTNEAVNKGVVDGYIAGSSGNLDTVNVWTGSSVFTNTFTVPTPVVDNAFGNKKYVDDELTAFLASGTVDYQEVTSQTLGSTNVTLDPAVYTSMYACMVSSGGNGAPAGTVPSGANIKSFGGAGGYSVAKLPAYAGNAVYTIGAGGNTFTLPNGGLVMSITNGSDGAVGASGAGGVVSSDPTIIGCQAITGSTEPLQNPVTTDTILYSYNVGCLNGFGQGGSFRWDTGTVVAPTGYYALFIKFKK